MKMAFRKLFRLSILLLICLSCLYFFIHSSLFDLRDIEVSGNEKVSKEEILALSGLTLGTNIFTINNDIVVKSIEIHPMIAQAQIVRHLPARLELKIKERQVWALIPFEGIMLCIDKEGFCIDKLPNFSVFDHPIITMENMPERVNLGQAVNADQVKLTNKIWEESTEEFRQSLSDFHFDGDNELTIYTQNGTQIRIGNDERLDEKIDYLQQVVMIEADLAESGTQVLEYIDLRFEGQPVIKSKT